MVRDARSGSARFRQSGYNPDGIPRNPSAGSEGEGAQERARGPFRLSIPDGGLVCADCAAAMADKLNNGLIFKVDSATINILSYIMVNPLERLEKLAIEDSYFKSLHELIKKYAEYHLGIGELKSESFLSI